MVSRVGLLQEGPSKEKAKLNSQAVAGETVSFSLKAGWNGRERCRTVPIDPPPFLAVRLEFLYTDWLRIGPLVDTPNFDHKASELVHISSSPATSPSQHGRKTYLFCTFFIILPVEYDSNFIK